MRILGLLAACLFMAGSLNAGTSRPEWVRFDGGRFIMADSVDVSDFGSPRPSREIVVGSFEMSRTAVTVEQYKACVIEGVCTPPDSGGLCNWGRSGRELHPVNCVTREQAAQYAGFMRARLPTEAEWEFAASGGMESRRYPWGNREPGCENAVMNGLSGFSCGNDFGTQPVCSRPSGNTPEGLCDMAGNVYQWMADDVEVAAGGQVSVGRGGSFADFDVWMLRIGSRARFSRDRGYDNVGFRIVK